MASRAKEKSGIYEERVDYRQPVVRRQGGRGARGRDLAGLPRRCAPRNDGQWNNVQADSRA